MNSQICKSCTHFHQHYVLDKQRCTAINCGHCSHPRLKRKKPDAPACSHFLPADNTADLPDRAAVIHYLTTEILAHILSLELPPEVTL